MAGKKPEYEDALGSIFDFLFTNSTKKGKGLKPVKPTGVNYQDDLTATLAQLAANPYTQINNAGLAIFDEALNKSFIEFSIDKTEQHREDPRQSRTPYLDGDAGRVRVRTRELLGFVQAPGATIDKAFKKAKLERKWARLTGLGAGIDAAMAGVWAKKNGFSNGDAARLAGSAMMTPTYLSQADAHNMISENAVIAHFTSQKKAEEFSPPDITKAKSLYDEVHKAKVVNERQLSRILSARVAKGDIGTNDAKAILENFRRKIGEDNNTFKTIGGDGTGFTGLGYRSIIGENYYQRWKIEADPVEKKKLQKAYAVVQVMNRLKSGNEDVDLKKIGERINQTINELSTKASLTPNETAILGELTKQQSELAKLNKDFDYENGKWIRFATYGKDFTAGGDFKMVKRAMGIDIESKIERRNSLIEDILNQKAAGGTAAQIARWDNQIRRLQDENHLSSLQLDSLKGMSERDFRISAASAVGQFRYFKNYVLTGSFIQGMINGSFYNINTSGPGAPGDWATSKWYIKGKVGPWSDSEGRGAIAKGMVVPRDEISGAYSKLANLYYLTPVSIAKTLLWNGEGFAYLSWRNKNRTLNKLGRGPNLLTTLSLSGIPDTDWLHFFDNGVLNKRKLLDDPKLYFEFMDFLSSNSLGGISSLASGSKSWTQLLARGVHASSWLSGKLINNKVYKKLTSIGPSIRAWFGKSLSKLSSNEAWVKAANLFGAGGLGLRELIKTGIRALVAGLGISTGGIMTPIIWVVTEGLMWIGEKLAKPVVKIVTLVVLGLVFLVLAGISMTLFGRSTLTSQFLHIPPGPCEECIAQNPHAGMYPEPPAETGGHYPPIDSTCPLNFSPQRCTQGPTGNVSHYHQVKKAVDVGTGTGVWHAPSDGRVESYKAVTSCGASGGINYGGEVVFIDVEGNNYMVMHAKALVSAGSSVRKGDAVAVVETGLTKSDCWTGAHFHLHVSSAGVNQNALDWYNNKLNCSITGC